MINNSKLQRRFFTLIEILIVLSILAVTTSVIGINITGALRDQRFKTEVGVVLDKMRLAQDLMLVLRTDVHLIFFQESENKPIFMWIECDTPLGKHWKREIQRPKELKTIQYVDFRDDLKDNVTMGKVDMKFFSGGTVMSSGILRLSTSKSESDKGALQRFVYMAGYPRPLKSSPNPRDEEGILPENSSGFNERLTLYAMQEIQDLGPLNNAQTPQTPQIP